jgi:hypothetical protein
LYLPGGTTEMADFAEELSEAAATTGSGRAAALAVLVKGETELLNGEPQKAEVTLRHAAEMHRDTKTNSGESLSLARVAEASTELGQKWKARRLLQSAIKLAEGDPLASHLLVKIHGAMIEAAADDTEAAAIATKGESLLSDTDVCQQCSMSFRVAAANAFAHVGAISKARLHLEEAERVSEMWHGGPWPEAVRRARVEVEAAATGRKKG